MNVWLRDVSDEEKAEDRRYDSQGCDDEEVSDRVEESQSESGD